MKIGPYELKGKAILAPMAGVTDLPFRLMCRKLGAAMAVSEMVTSKKELWHTQKTQSRLQHQGEKSPISVQIAGTDPEQMANAAIFNVQQGAQIIDINMGCPAKKVCNVQAGSALLKNEPLVTDILNAVISAVDVPVTLKIRTGWDKAHINATNIAQIAEKSGVSALVIHGRTRACAYKGIAEYDTIKAVKQRVNIPIIANGDIDSVDKANFVLQYTGADAVMIGRVAQSNPWIFHEINSLNGKYTVSIKEVYQVVIDLLDGIYHLYGKDHGVRIARKHIRSFVYPLKGGKELWNKINQIKNSDQQRTMVNQFFSYQLH